MTGKRLTAFLTSIVMFVMIIIPSVPQADAAEAMRDITTMELVRDMGIGINLGNTLEACGDWVNGKTPADYETAWGSPIVTEEMIHGYKNAGFGVLRIPVAWSNLMKDDGNYKISPDYMARVTEVVDWAIDSGLYVIINIHWDNGWVNTFPENKNECMKRFETMWEQIADNYKDYGDHLMFESQNEELGWEKLWNRWAGNDGKTESYALVNEINQKFVDVIRKSGGNNAERHLLISGYNTGIDVTCDPLFKMPSDPANRMAVSVHYYSPSTFAILEEDADWGKAQSTWGTAKEIEDLNNEMDMMKSTFVDNGIPVIIGEYGCPTKNKEPESVMKFLTSVCEAAYSRNMCPVLWDTPGGRYDRLECKMADSELGEKLCAIAGTKPTYTEDTLESVTYKTEELKKNSNGEYIVPLGSNAKSLKKAIITLSCTSSENSGWFCGGGGLTFDSVKTADGKKFWSSKGFNYDCGKEKVLITFDGKFKDDKDNEFDAEINCTEAGLVDWWHSSEKYPEGGDDVSCEFKAITLYYDGDPGTVTEPETPDVVKGDTDCNGIVNSKDLVMSVNMIIGRTETDEASLKNADMNDDGKLTIIDIIMLKNVLMSAE